MNIDYKRISFFLPSLYGGGAERVAVNLLKGMAARNVPLDLVLVTAKGPYLSQVPQEVRIVNLAAGRTAKSILPLSNYLQQEKPLALLSHMNDANVIAVLARGLARIKTNLVLVEHDTLSASKSKLFRGRLVPPLMKLLYPYADKIVGVSKGVAQDLVTQLHLAEEKINVIYNPVVDSVLLGKAQAALEHPWFEEQSPPVLLAVGRLSQQKDFLTLIEAFAILRKQRQARLLILGEGESRQELEAAIARLNIFEDVSLPGFVDNPYAYMSRASAFVLSSRHEGLPTVLIEAMACGCPVVATDCPSGPREILAVGEYGPLVPVGDATALAVAMLQVLDTPVVKDVLIQRAMYFSTERVVPEYLNLLGYKQSFC